MYPTTVRHTDTSGEKMSKGSFTLDGTGIHIHCDGATLSISTDAEGSFSLAAGEFTTSTPIPHLGTTIDATLQPTTPSGFSLLLHLIMPTPVAGADMELPITGVTAAAILIWDLSGESAAQAQVQQRYEVHAMTGTMNSS
jgi:hypothetical protein